MGINICDTPTNFTLTDYVSGNSISLNAYSGKAIVLSFLCIRCGFCLQWLQHLQDIHADFETNPDVQVMGVIYNYNDASDGTHSGPVTTEWITERLTAIGLTVTFPLLMDGPWASSVAQQYMAGMVGPSIGFPHSYLISRDFVITNKWHRLSTSNGQPVAFDSSNLDDTEYFVRHRLDDLQIDRPAWDTVLALDYSGSMNSNVTVHGVTRPKVEFLQEAASTLLKVWKDYALCGDRAGSVFFGCHASMGSALSGLLSGTHVDDMLSAIETHAADGCTAMGAGVASSLDLLSGSSNRQFVVLFTDGMQNRNPLVYVAEISGGGVTCYERRIDNIAPAEFPDGVWMCVCDSDGGQSNYAGSLPVNLELVNANIHTIGIGAGVIYQNMLNQIAAATAGQFRMDVDIWPNLKEFFIETLVEMYRGTSLQVLQKGQGILTEDQSKVIKLFRLNSSVRKITVLLSWTDPEHPLTFQLRKEGIPIDLRHKLKEESTFRFATLAFPHYQMSRLPSSLIPSLWAPLESATAAKQRGNISASAAHASFSAALSRTRQGESVDAEGDWELAIHRTFADKNSAAAYHYMILADEKSLDFAIDIPPVVFQVGQTIPISIRVADKMRKPVRMFSVDVDVHRPTVSLNRLLAERKIDVRAGKKLEEALEREDILAEMRKTERETVRLRSLFQDRAGRRKELEGRFHTFYKNTRVPGLYRFEFHIRGISGQAGVFERSLSRHVLVAAKAAPMPSGKKEAGSRLKRN